MEKNPIHKLNNIVNDNINMNQTRDINENYQNILKNSINSLTKVNINYKMNHIFENDFHYLVICVI